MNINKYLNKYEISEIKLLLLQIDYKTDLFKLINQLYNKYKKPNIYNIYNNFLNKIDDIKLVIICLYCHVLVITDNIILFKKLIKYLILKYPPKIYIAIKNKIFNSTLNDKTLIFNSSKYISVNIMILLLKNGYNINDSEKNIIKINFQKKLNEYKILDYTNYTYYYKKANDFINIL